MRDAGQFENFTSVYHFRVNTLEIIATVKQNVGQCRENYPLGVFM